MHLLSSVVRTAAHDLSLPTKFPKQRAQIADLTIRTLEDKTSSARRYSIQLLCKLLETHPFGALHGGTLNLHEWQERYDKVAEELANVDTVEMEKARMDAGVASADEGSDEEEESLAENGYEGEGCDKEVSSPSVKKEKRAQKPRISTANLAAVAAEQTCLDPALVTKLRLTKKYYADALRFVKQIESATPILCQLLVSTTKSEVLEAMRFFRTAYEYNIHSADQGIKTMLHLIWTKDNNSTSSEEGMDGKGVKASLIEVYRSLYFDVVPDLAPKQQVNRIAKNMIEWVNLLIVKLEQPADWPQTDLRRHARRANKSGRDDENDDDGWRGPQRCCKQALAGLRCVSLRKSRFRMDWQN